MLKTNQVCLPMYVWLACTIAYRQGQLANEVVVCDLHLKSLLNFQTWSPFYHTLFVKCGGLLMICPGTLKCVIEWSDHFLCLVCGVLVVVSLESHTTSTVIISSNSLALSWTQLWGSTRLSYQNTYNLHTYNLHTYNLHTYNLHTYNLHSWKMLVSFNYPWIESALWIQP